MAVSACPSKLRLMSGAAFFLLCIEGLNLYPCLFPSPCSAPDESSSSGGHQLSSPERRPPAGSDTDSSVEEESDFDTMPEIESDKNVIRTKVQLALHLGPGPALVTCQGF